MIVSIYIVLAIIFYFYDIDKGEIKEDVSGMALYLTEESLEKYGWYFKEDDY